MWDEKAFFPAILIKSGSSLADRASFRRGPRWAGKCSHFGGFETIKRLAHKIEDG
jgi:hypothetical protein